MAHNKHKNVYTNGSKAFVKLPELVHECRIALDKNVGFQYFYFKHFNLWVQYLGAVTYQENTYEFILEHSGNLLQLHSVKNRTH